MARERDPGIGLELSLYDKGTTFVAGIDEVGRGAWAGPLSVGVCLATRESLLGLPAGVRDSKLLNPVSRELLFDPLRRAVSEYAIGHASSNECDELGMTKAEALATSRALSKLSVSPAALIMDGKYDFTGLGAICVVGADRLCRIVAAASVLAKVTRDRLMVSEAKKDSRYGFEKNKGYPSPHHRASLAMHGLSSIHRKSWSFARDLVVNDASSACGSAI